MVIGEQDNIRSKKGVWFKGLGCVGAQMWVLKKKKRVWEGINVGLCRIQGHGCEIRKSLDSGDFSRLKGKSTPSEIKTRRKG